jgi:hypothetical protein
MALNRSALEWRGDRLHRIGQREPLLHIKPDACWPQMWRIEWPDGRLSDMADRTRIRDAAVLLAMAEFNSEQQESCAGAPPSASNGSGAISVPPAAGNAPAAVPPLANSAGVANKPKRDRAAYMRVYMRRRRGVVREGRQA